MGFSQAIRLNLSSYSSLSPCQTRVNQKQKTLVTFLTSCRKGKRRSLLTVKSVLNNTRPSFNDNGTAEEPSKILLDKLFARTQEQTNENSVYPPYSSLGGLESDLQAALMALLKREEDLQDAERKEKLRETEANLKKQTEEWLVAQEEVSKFQEETVKRLGKANETMEDFKRVKKLLTDVRFELISSREALLSSREQMGEKEVLLEKQLEELEEQRRSVLSYMQSLRDACGEVESERVKLRVAEAKNFALEREISIQKELIEELREELKKERSLLKQAMHDVSTIQDELDKRTKEFQVSQNLLQEKESSLVEAKLEIQHLKSEQASLELLLQEKDEEFTEARNQLEEVNREVKELKMIMRTREDQLTQATELLKEKDVHLNRIEGELGSSKIQASEAEMVVERIAELTSRLVQDQMQQQPLEKQPYGDYGMENKRLVMELNFTRENLRLKEMEVLAAQRALTLKDEEINVLMGRLEAKEREVKKLKEETVNDGEDLKMLYALAQERIEGRTMGDLAIEKLQLEAVQLEVEAATSALQKLAEMSTELLTQADMSVEADSDFFVLPENENRSADCIAEVKSEVGRLWSLTERLLENAGVVD
ncbi:unnamed protein product, partial [Brassica oleracea]